GVHRRTNARVRSVSWPCHFRRRFPHIGQLRLENGRLADVPRTVGLSLMFAVKSSDAVSRLRLSPNENKQQSNAHGRRERLKTPVNKLSCADWLPHDRDFVLGCLVLSDERRRRPAHNRSRGFPAVALPPVVGAAS